MYPWYCTCMYLHVDPFVWNKLQLRLRRESDGSIHDIYDGSEYKKYVRMGFLSSKANVSLLLNTDGVQGLHIFGVAYLASYQ